MLSLSFKCVFCRPEHNAKGGPMKMNFEGFKMQKKWNISTDRVHSIDEKNGVFCLVIMITFRVMVIKMSKRVRFGVCYWWQQKNSHILGKICKCIWKILLSSFKK